MKKYTREEQTKEQRCRDSAGTEEEICIEIENDMNNHIRKYYLNEENRELTKEWKRKYV